MDVWLWIPLLLVVYVIIYGLRRRKWPDSRLPIPSGGLPILGNLLQIDSKRAHLSVTKMAHDTGPIFVLRMVNRPVILVSDYQCITEIFITKSSDFCDRPRTFRSNMVSIGYRGLVSANVSPKFKAIKNAVMKSLKIHSGGIDDMQDIIHDMTAELVTDIKSVNEQNIDIRDMLYNFLLRVVYYFVLGEYVSVDDPRFHMARSMERNIVSSTGLGAGQTLETMPWLRFFGNKTYVKLQEGMKMNRMIWNAHHQRLVTTLEEHGVQCAMHGVLQAQRALVDNDGSPIIDDEDIMVTMLDLVIAGITTTGPTLYVLLNLMANRPDIQGKIHKELDRELNGRTVAWTDRDKLHYTRATILEVLRNSPAAPLVPRWTTTDTSLADYNIPKDSGVIINIWALHHDPQIWENPYDYNPERFLDTEGHLVPVDHVARRRLVPFGGGPRVCAGEMFAMARIFLVTATLLQHFQILPATDGSTAPTDPRLAELGLTLYPQASKIRFISR